MNNQQKIKELQDQIDALKAEAQVAESFDWENSPVICELNGYRWYLGPEADEELTWQDAKDWCKSVGGELPTRDILLQAYLNEDIKPLIIDSWYWSGTEFYATGAWAQHFLGSQYYNTKTSASYVRAVKRVKV